MMNRIYFMVVYTALFLNSYCQSDSIRNNMATENYFSLNYDNDFFSATDRYYTQGIKLTLIHQAIKHSPFSCTLIKLNKTARNYYGLHLQQDVFTPKSIRYMGGAVYAGERPFTAVFFVSHSLTSINTTKKMLLRTQLDLGILGPDAKGEEEQKGIHKALDNIEPLGWENQLSRDYIFNYTAKVEKGVSIKKNREAMVSATARLGSLYTDVGVGLNFRFGILSPYFNNLGLEGNALISKRNFQMYAVAKANGRIVGSNATLQGGLTNAGNVYALRYNEINRFVADLSASLVVAYKKLILEYTKVYITPEFKNGVDHGWGKCVITLCF
jgi:lipid A 3-O-deacylase